MSVGVVWRWRKALEVDRVNNPGSNRLVRKAAKAGAAVIAATPCPESLRLARRRVAVEQNLGAWLVNAPDPRDWTADHVALLGTDTDEAIAQRIGKSAEAVRLKRQRLGIARMKRRR